MQPGEGSMIARLRSALVRARSRLGSRGVARPGLAVYLALVLIVVAAVAIVLYDHHELRAWTPNIATSALSIAITITVVSWIVRREARRRIQPRVERTLYWIGLGYRGFLHAIVIDYAGTHHATFKPIPVTAPEMMELWLAEQEHKDVPRRRLTGQALAHAHSFSPRIHRRA